jgi:uracil-DNA glycosylase
MRDFKFDGSRFAGVTTADFNHGIGPRRPMIIGQAPARSGGPPITGRCGEKLADLLGISMEKFLETFVRGNLIQEWPGKSGRGDEFPRSLGIMAAFQIMSSGALKDRRIVLLGREVARCFRITPDKADYLDKVDLVGGRALLLPHPSGVSRWWNCSRRSTAAKRALRAFLAEYL